MALADDLRAYFVRHGHAGPPDFENPRLILVGEFHGSAATRRLDVSVRVLRQIFREGRYRFFANESFLNATVIRRGVREDWQHGILPPPYNPVHPAGRYEDAKAIFVNAFHPLLNDFKARPAYILHIGSRATGTARDRRLAHHFFEEMHDRGLGTHSQGVLLLGAAHAAAVQFHRDAPVTTRMHLMRKLYPCVSMLLVTDYTRDGSDDDRVIKIGGPAESVKLTAVAGPNPISVSTRRVDSPFRHVRLDDSDAGHSMSEQYEYVMVARMV